MGVIKHLADKYMVISSTQNIRGLALEVSYASVKYWAIVYAQRVVNRLKLVCLSLREVIRNVCLVLRQDIDTKSLAIQKT